MNGRKITIKHKRLTWRGKNRVCNPDSIAHTTFMHASCMQTAKKCFWSHKLFVLATNRKSSNGIYYKRVFYIVTLKTSARPPACSPFLNRAVPKESVWQLWCKWTCLTNFQFSYATRIHILTSSSQEWCYSFISSNVPFFVFAEGKKWKRKIRLDLLHILL